MSLSIRTGPLVPKPTHIYIAHSLNPTGKLRVPKFLFYLTKKGEVLPYSLPSVGPGADPSVQAVSPQVTLRSRCTIHT